MRELWRYPVKSLQGERVDAIDLTKQGLTGDRSYAIFDATTGLGLTARRVPELLFASARARDDGTAEIRLPDGSVAEDDQALSAWLGRPVELRSTGEAATHRYETVEDFEREGTSGWRAFEGASGAFHDSADAHVSLVSAATLGAWEPRRFRSNVLLDGVARAEDGLVGRQVCVGDALLHVGMRLERCVMVTRPQPGDVARDLDVLRTIHREWQHCLAVGGTVERPGRVSVGDVVRPV